MNSEFGSGGDGSTEQENAVQSVEKEGKESMSHKRVAPGGWDQVEKRKHGEGGHEHVVVDQGGVAGEGHCDHIANERHDDEDEQELRPPQDEVEHSRHHFCGGVGFGGEILKWREIGGARIEGC